MHALQGCVGTIKVPFIVVYFLQTKTVPKTSSRKIARAWCRKGFLAGTLKAVYKKSFATKSNGGNRGSNSNGISSFEIEGGSQANEGNSSTLPAFSSNAPLTKEKIAELRAMDKTELTNKLRLDVARMGEIPPDSIDNDTALVTILDSLSISQFAGRLESAYAVKLSDEYLFREGVTLTKLAEVAKLGYAPDDVGNDGDAHGPSTSSSSPSSRPRSSLAPRPSLSSESS